MGEESEAWGRGRAREKRQRTGEESEAWGRGRCREKR